MIFRDYLKEIVDNVDGAIAAAMMADDGVPVADYIADPSANLNIQNISIEYTHILKNAAEICKTLLNGDLEEFSLSSGDFNLVFLPVHENYFLALLVKRGGNLGKGRFLLKQYRPKILKEL